MPRWIRSLFAWEIARDTGVYRYWRNRVTGKRAISYAGSGYQPIDRRWLEGDGG